MIIDFYTYNLKKALANEVERAQSAETALKTDTFADVVYNASGKTIDFYNGFNQKIDSIDASDFVIDGMVENVTLSGNILTISFNTESGKQDIDIDLTKFINPAYYWTSAETKTYVDDAIADIDLSGYTTTAQTEELKNKLQVDEETISKALNELHEDKAEKAYVDNSLSGKQDTLVSGTNIKTINGNSILGEGNINIDVDLSGYTTTAHTEEIERVTSIALNELYENKVSSTSIRTIVQITQADYDRLPLKDKNTLYCIVG